MPATAGGPVLLKAGNGAGRRLAIRKSTHSQGNGRYERLRAGGVNPLTNVEPLALVLSAPWRPALPIRNYLFNQ